MIKDIREVMCNNNVSIDNYESVINTVNDVIKTLNEVPSEFYSLTEYYYQDGEIKSSDKIRHHELRFMKAFAIQFDKLFKGDRSYNRLSYDFEIPKKFMWSEREDIKIRETFLAIKDKYEQEIDMLKYFTTIPDFLVHAGQSNVEAVNQHLIIEAKLNSNPKKSEIFKDIFHTFIYSNKYNFQCSIMLLVNLDKKRWIKIFREYIENGWYFGELKKTKKIFVVFKESYEKDPVHCALFDLFSNPICPKCYQFMINRTVKKGVNPGTKFWGCPSFPKCKETKNMN